MSEGKFGKLSRRRFLEGSVGAAVAASIGCGGGDNTGASAAGGQLEGGGTGAGATSGAATGGAPSGGGATAAGGAGTAGSGSTDNALVALVRGDDWAQAVLDAIALVGGLADLTGRRVMLKPNVISTDPPPTTTSAEIVRGAIRAVKARGATTVLVAEDGFTGDTLQSMQANGITQVCTEEGAEAVELKNGLTTRISPPGATNWSGGINLYQEVDRADYIINMPVCKSHSLAAYTMALKNWYGCVPQSDRSHTNLGYRLAELHLAKQEHFVILDATRAMVTGGPQTGQTAEPRIVVASPDAIAADVAGLCIHKQFGTRSDAVFNLGVWDQPQVRRALELQFPGWLSGAENFPYVAQGVDEHAEIMAWRDA